MMYFLIRAGLALAFTVSFIVCLKTVEWIWNKFENK